MRRGDGHFGRRSPSIIKPVWDYELGQTCKFRKLVQFLFFGEGFAFVVQVIDVFVASLKETANESDVNNKKCVVQEVHF